MSTTKRLLQYLKPVRHWLPETLLYSLLAGVFGTSIFLMLKPVLEVLMAKNDVVQLVPKPEVSFSALYIKDLFYHYFTSLAINKGKFFSLLFVCGILFLCSLLANVFRYLLSRLLIRLRLSIVQKLRTEVFNKYIHQSLSYYQNTNKGNLMATIINEVNEVEGALIQGVQTIIKDPIQIIVSFIFLFIFSVKLTLFTLIFIPIVGFAISRITQPLKRVSSINMNLYSKIVQIIEESLGGIKVVQGFASEKFLKLKFTTISKEFTSSSKKLSGLRELASPMSEMLGTLAALLLVLFGGYLIFYKIDPSLTGENFISYIAMYYTVTQPMKALSSAPANLQRGLAAAEKIFTILDEPIVITDAPNALPIKQFDKGLHVKNVSFKYKEVNVINNLDIFIHKGKTIALVGESGSGKTTLSDLVLRFYDPQQGEVTIDDINIKSYTLESYRNLFGVVTQDAVLFNDTIKNNIIFGQEGVTDDQIRNAAKAANALEFIEKTDEGFETNVGDRGMKLSGGQKQRVTIARALLKNPPILILDEATSALDTESEKLVQEAINKVIENRTCIIIAHRLSTIKHADEIIVLQQGNIVERGSHDTLLAKQGYYSKLVAMQEIS
jgi:ATP-binding cassette, subfamily B, bacterial MsbA